MSKVLPKISAPGSSKFPSKGPHNPNVGTSGSGMAPRPKTSNGLLSQSGASASSQAGLARVKGTGTSPSGSSGPAGSFKPDRKPGAGLNNTATPIQSGAKAPAPRGGPSGLRAGGRNQTWPNGAMYTDGSKKGGRGQGGAFQKAASRKTKGAPFFGEWPS